MNHKVDCAGWNISVGEVGKRRRRRIDDARRRSALASGVCVPDVYCSNADGGAAEIVYDDVEGSSGRIGRIYRNQVFRYRLLVSLTHTSYDMVVCVVLYEAPEHDIESHEYDYDEE